MALRLGIPQRAIQQHAADASLSERRLDRQRAEHQGRRIADADRQLAHRADQQRADSGREREVEQVVDMLAQAVGAQHETAGAEGALEQAFDGLRVLWRFGQDGDVKFAHDGARDSIWRRRGPSLEAAIPGLHQSLLMAGWDR
jgi:hypothetical protein